LGDRKDHQLTLRATQHATVGKLPEAIKSKIVGGVLFGDTRNVQDKGRVPGYPLENIKMFCPKEDGVCLGGLYPQVTNGHFVYPFNGNGDEAVRFLKGKIGSGKE
jgi:cutinase